MSQYRWMTDESEDASGDDIEFADESEYVDDTEGEDPDEPAHEPMVGEEAGRAIRRALTEGYVDLVDYGD